MMSAPSKAWDMIDLEPAYLLHSRPFRESSVLAELLVGGRGRVGVIMRGQRSIRKSAPQLFQPLLVGLAGQGELKSLRHVEPASSLPLLQGPALFSGFYLNELLVRLLPRDQPQPAIFVAYVKALAALVEQPSGGAELETPLRQFERCLLESLGYAVQFDIDSEGNPVQPGWWYAYVPEVGMVRTASGLHGAVLLAAARGDYMEAAVRGTIKQVLRQALAHLLGGRPLKSRELFLRSGE